MRGEWFLRLVSGSYVRTTNITVSGWVRTVLCKGRKRCELGKQARQAGTAGDASEDASALQEDAQQRPIRVAWVAE